jgi:hypothetical protein
MDTLETGYLPEPSSFLARGVPEVALKWNQLKNNDLSIMFFGNITFGSSLMGQLCSCGLTNFNKLKRG